MSDVSRGGAVRRRGRVLLVSPAVRPPWHNGTVVMARDIVAGGERFGYRVLGSPGQAPPPGVDVQVDPVYGRGGGSANALLGRAKVLWRLVRGDDCELHHFLFSPNPTTSTAIKAALRWSRKPALHTVPSQPTADGDLGRLMVAETTVCVSESTAILLQSSGIAGVRVIRPGVALPPRPADRMACRQRLADNAASRAWATGWGDAPVMLYAGDLEFSDGAEVFASAARALKSRQPDLRFVFACRAKTPAANGRLQALKRRIASAGLTARTTFLGAIPEFHTLLGAVDAVVMPVDSLYAKVDTPYVLLEAMALGRPVIVSNLPPLQELAALGDGTVVVPKGDPEATADAMARLAADPDDAARLGERARATIAASFSLTRMARAYETLYDELLTRHGR